MILCLCRGVAERSVQSVIGAGAETLDDIAAACEAGSDCGACQEMLLDMLDRARRCSRNATEAVGVSA